ncbi:MAG: ferritin [Flavobacteriaceae bacterium]|nr:ferritin [Bacteroidia bacterium]MBT8288140.1 ferritin [Bacteroidia bacterium]NNF74879.1 ferritin [Flavobacteriaceae bacterium]NNK72298.1 ferritin [Flavobacteriaceae bacterium]
MNTSIEKLLNDQIKYEAKASMQYLAMASWADENGYNGIADFFYNQSVEELDHMRKLVRFVNERGGHVIIPALDQPVSSYDSLNSLFESFLKSEEFVTDKINHIIFECLQHKDYNVHNFMQWYVTEQLEEEATARSLLDKLNIIGDDKSGHYLFDRDINDIATEAAPPA